MIKQKQIQSNLPFIGLSSLMRQLDWIDRFYRDLLQEYAVSFSAHLKYLEVQSADVEQSFLLVSCRTGSLRYDGESGSHKSMRKIAVKTLSVEYKQIIS